MWREPEWTLGWQVQDWAEAYFRVPGGKFYGQPLVFTGWQSMFLADWYAVDRLGRWVYPRGIARLAKKIGKSPVGGVIAAAEFCGPSQFDGWDGAGEPVGRRRDAPWVQIAAVSEDQTANTYTPFATMLRESVLPDELGLDVGVSAAVVRGHLNAKCEAVTSSAGSREGQPITSAIGDEAQQWTRSNGGKRLYRVLRRNVSPMGGRVLLLANAPEPGLESAAEDIEADPDALVYGPQYQVEGVDLGDGAAVRAGLRVVYRDAPWVDVEAVARDVVAHDQDVFEAHRFYFNWPVGAGSVLADRPEVSADDLVDGAPVAVGFWGARASQAAAVVAVHMVTGAAYLLRFWERPVGLPAREKWEVPRGEVAAVVAEAFARFRVARARLNPAGWREEVAGWQAMWDKKLVAALPRHEVSLVDEAVEAAQTALQHGQLRLSGMADDAMLRVHVERCRVTRRQSGAHVLRSLAAPDSGESVEVAWALVLAWRARLEALADGWVDAPADPVLAVG